MLTAHIVVEQVLAVILLSLFCVFVLAAAGVMLQLYRDIKQRNDRELARAGVNPPKAKRGSTFEFVEKGGKQPPNPPPAPTTLLLCPHGYAVCEICSAEDGFQIRQPPTPQFSSLRKVKPPLGEPLYHDSELLP